MDLRHAASHNATATDELGHDDVIWLEPSHVRTGRVRRLAAATFARVSATAAVGVLLLASSANTAFGPSAHAAADLAAGDAHETAKPLAGPSLPASVWSEGFVAPNALNAPITASVPEDYDAIEADFDSFRRTESLRADQASDPNEVLQFGAMRVKRWIVEAIMRAAAAVDVDPVYMMALADKESSLRLESKAGTSSAEGLYQFITKTWLEVIRTFGPRHGLITEAAAIGDGDSGFTVADEAMRERIMALRNDPYISAVMAAEMKKRDKQLIERQIGREMTRSEYYLAHFFGAQSAGKFLKILDEKPKSRAPKAFPAAARANKNLFFARQGKKNRQLTVAEVYTRLDQMIDKRLDRYSDIKVAKELTAGVKMSAGF
ncbi:lytic transglycosylase domain-containing protein [Salinarimonas soli]|uniref:Lytic transglycosylase domain-containing protein n=1 Tax=Salinarimonas soli TaxID=1638099 RepID=A0A5B2VR01_9HYPH|nr:lytic transglycosylase domain-containing protein [Salinarimonas soli]KAA2241224.1 lytic transglycosylase domain-containing protein [Salinarimonas soli]